MVVTWPSGSDRLTLYNTYTEKGTTQRYLNRIYSPQWPVPSTI